MAIHVKPLGYISYGKPKAIHKAKEHLKYIEANREKHRNKPELFNEKEDKIDKRIMFKKFEEQPHSFKDVTIHKFVLTISEDERDRLQLDLKELTRETMMTFEARYGHKLDWIAGIHDDVGHPHVHLVIRGTDLSGRKVEIYKKDISELKRIAEREKVRQVERNLGLKQARNLFKELEKENKPDREYPYQERDKEYHSPASSQSDVSKTMFNILDQLIKQSQRELERVKRQAWRDDERESKKRNKGRGMER